MATGYIRSLLQSQTCQLSSVSFPRLCLVSEEANKYHNALSSIEERLVLTRDSACCSSTQKLICALLPPQQALLPLKNVHSAHRSCIPSNLDFPVGTGICSRLCQSLHVDLDLLFLPQGHKSQMICMAFASDATEMVTATKDSTWRVWNIDARYHQ